MTILPKKKQNSGKNSNEDKVESDRSERYASYGHNGHHNHNSHSRGHSPTNRWTLNNRSDEKRSAGNDSDVQLDGNGPTHSKRRHRNDNLRSIIRKNKSVSNVVVNNEVVVDVDNGSDGTKCADNSDVEVVINSNTSRSDSPSGYNSGDEYEKPPEMWSKEEWDEKEKHFEKKLRKKGLIIKKMGEDGACLFRAVADQIYGDQEMHVSVRKLCMDYMAKNSDYFSQYVTEDFEAYVERKRCDHIHGNHIEMQAMSEIFNRPIELFHYSSEPINIFQGCHQTDNEPIRLSYHRNIHYNSIVDPYKATIGVGLGLPALKPGLAEKTLMDKALHISEEQQLEQAMLEDKLRATDWEATNEAIEEQIARESYVEWLRESEMRSHKIKKSASATSTTTANEGSSKSSHGNKSPNWVSPRSSPKACSSGTNDKNSVKADFSLVETASFMHQLPPSVFGLKDWNEDDILARVLAQSQEEYIDALKRDSKSSNTNSESKTPPPSSSSSSNS